MSGEQKADPIVGLMYSFGWEPEHALQVRDLALSLFDQLEDLHGLDRRARRILEAAAILHDIGFSVAESKHHKHSYRLIRQQNLPEFDAREVDLVANVARYHRKALPKRSHKNFRDLDDREQALVQKLSAILRVADGMDRSHTASVEGIMCESRGDRLILRAQAEGPWLSLDLAGGARKAELFEKVYGLPIEFRTQEERKA